MKKPYHYTEKSSYTCHDCGVRIKANLVARKTITPKFCYKHHKMRQPKANVVLVPKGAQT